MIRRKQFIYLAILVVCIILGILSHLFKKPQIHYDHVVLVHQYIDHPNLDRIKHSLRKELQLWANKKKINLKLEFENAHKDQTVANNIAIKQANSSPDVIISLTTPTSQIALKQARKKEIPLVFGAVTDPISAGLLDRTGNPTKGATGVTDKGPIKKQLELIIKLMGINTRIGIIYNPSEANSKSAVNEIRSIAKNLNIKTYVEPITASHEIRIAGNSLISQVDCFYLPPDNSVLSSLPALVTISRNEKKPIFVTDSGSLELGAVATLGVNYSKSGELIASKAIQVLEGEKIQNISPSFSSGGQLYINLGEAEAQGLSIPNDLKLEAKIIKTK